MVWAAKSARKSELPSNWDQIRLLVLEDDDYECQWPMGNGEICGEYANQVDHKRRGNDHRRSNLWSLCKKHHASKTGREGRDARWGLAPRRGKLFEPHPGLRY